MRRDAYPNFSGSIDGELSFDAITLSLDTGSAVLWTKQIPRGLRYKLPNVEREYYALLGWYDNAELSGDSVTHVLETQTTDVKYWGYYKRKYTSIKALGNDSQVVVAGDSIKPITLKYENITDLHFKDIPKTLDPYDDPEAKTFLLQGAIPEDFGDSTLVMSICAKGLDNNDTAFVKLVIKHKPGKTKIKHVSGKTTQTVNAGDSIEPIVFKYELAMNALGLNFPKGTLVAERDTKAKTITVKGAVNKKVSGEYNDI